MEEFISRESAGVLLGTQLARLNLRNPYLLAIPRGGVQVAKGVADALRIPIHTIVAKKVALPEDPEVAIGAMTEDEMGYLDQEIFVVSHVSHPELDSVAELTNHEVKRRAELYGRPDEGRIANSTVIVVDDGVATGASMIASLKRIKKLGPQGLIAAVPVCARAAVDPITRLANRFVTLGVSDRRFFAVADFYQEWKDLTDLEIVGILKEYERKYAGAVYSSRSI